MARIRRRGFDPNHEQHREGQEYGRRGNARGKDTKRSTGGNPQLPNRPRRDR